jgi:lipopolysaccharide export system protein LptA
MIIDIKKTLYSQIESYCNSNGIADINLFINQMVEKGFTVEAYGDAPRFVAPKEKKPVKSEKKIKKEETEIKKEKINYIDDNGIQMVEIPSKTIKRVLK